MGWNRWSPDERRGYVAAMLVLGVAFGIAIFLDAGMLVGLAVLAGGIFGAAAAYLALSR
jgi:hypothetical protein